MYDERMLDFLSKLTEMHVAPDVSDPRKITEIPDDERSEDEGRPNWSGDGVNDFPDTPTWRGIYKDVGIFTEHEWHLVMCKCLASMGMVGRTFPQLLYSSSELFRNTTRRYWITYHRPVRG